MAGGKDGRREGHLEVRQGGGETGERRKVEVGRGEGKLKLPDNGRGRNPMQVGEGMMKN